MSDLDQQIAAAEADLAAASTFMDRHRAGQKLDTLNGQKLAACIANPQALDPSSIPSLD